MKLVFTAQLIGVSFASLGGLIDVPIVGFCDSENWSECITARINLSFTNFLRNPFPGLFDDFSFDVNITWNWWLLFPPYWFYLLVVWALNRLPPVFDAIFSVFADLFDLDLGVPGACLSFTGSMVLFQNFVILVLVILLFDARIFPCTPLLALPG